MNPFDRSSHTLGIGLLTAVFSTVNAAVLRPLPYEDARRLVPGPLPWMVVSAGLFVLLITCAKVATVLLARAWTRRGEIGVRMARGADVRVLSRPCCRRCA